MNLYWCYDTNDGYAWGLFIVAENPKKARYIYSKSVEVGYADTRYKTEAKDVDCPFSCEVPYDDAGRAFLRKYKAGYHQE